MRWNSLRLAGTGDRGDEHEKLKLFKQRNIGKKNVNLLISPLHCHFILLWQVAPGLLKSQAAQVASSTIADGCNIRNLSDKLLYLFIR